MVIWIHSCMTSGLKHTTDMAACIVKLTSYSRAATCWHLVFCLNPAEYLSGAFGLLFSLGTCNYSTDLKNILFYSKNNHIVNHARFCFRSTDENVVQVTRSITVSFFHKLIKCDLLVWLPAAVDNDDRVTVISDHGKPGTCSSVSSPTVNVPRYGGGPGTNLL